MIYNGNIQLNYNSASDYPVKGVDVSSYQGDIDWKVLSNEGLDFAFIKATEGSSFKDENFDFNWEQASKTDLKIGAYHFFSYDSPGSTQADNFIESVAKKDGMLPPVVDIEFYGDKEKNPPSKEDTMLIMDELLEKLEKHYGQKPIIYATEKSYRLYIEDTYDNYPIWIRNVVKTPDEPNDGSWTFWQYSNREQLKGYNGKERFIDMNVFNGSRKEFERFCTNN